MEKITVFDGGACPFWTLIGGQCRHPEPFFFRDCNVGRPPPKGCPLRKSPLTIELAEGV